MSAQHDTKQAAKQDRQGRSLLLAIGWAMVIAGVYFGITASADGIAAGGLAVAGCALVTAAGLPPIEEMANKYADQR